MSHDCIDRIDKALLEHSTRLSIAFTLSNPSRELIQVATMKSDPSSKKKPKVMYASFCPFCGLSLEQQNKEVK
jgi:hypothetical protein